MPGKSIAITNAAGRRCMAASSKCVYAQVSTEKPIDWNECANALLIAID